MVTNRNNTAQDVWYDYFIEILHKRYPKKSHLIEALMELLSIEREAVYRRLRRYVLFSANEIGIIAAAWNISLDELVGIHSGQVSFQMRQLNYINPSKDEISFLRYVVQSIKRLQNSPDAEFMNICNTLPRQILAGYKCLNQFYLFKWIYQYGNTDGTIPYSQAAISRAKSQLTTEYYQAIKQVPNSSFIFDRHVFDYLINDIQYFHSIYLITDEEKEDIKEELHNLLDYMQEVANNGCYPETQNKVHLYISQLHVGTNYSYTFTPEANVCYIHVFEKYEIYTFNEEMVSNFKTWVQMKKRTSIQISEADEKRKIEFFTKQRKLVDTL